MIEWIAAARAAHRVTVPDVDYHTLIHTLTCTMAPPAYLGLREPQSLDATILQMADRLHPMTDTNTLDLP